MTKTETGAPAPLTIDDHLTSALRVAGLAVAVRELWAGCSVTGPAAGALPHVIDGLCDAALAHRRALDEAASHGGAE